MEGVEFHRVKAVGGQAERLTKALVMHDLPRAEEFDRVADVGVVAHTENHFGKEFAVLVYAM